MIRLLPASEMKKTKNRNIAATTWFVIEGRLFEAVLHYLPWWRGCRWVGGQVGPLPPMFHWHTGHVRYEYKGHNLVRLHLECERYVLGLCQRGPEEGGEEESSSSPHSPSWRSLCPLPAAWRLVGGSAWQPGLSPKLHRHRCQVHRLNAHHYSRWHKTWILIVLSQFWLLHVG